MSKFKVGDKVKMQSTIPSSNWSCDMDKYLGKVLTITGHSKWYKVKEDREQWYWEEGWLTLIKEGKPMRTFRLLKELPELKKGAIVQEKCDDGTQNYRLADRSHSKYEDEAGTHLVEYPRGAIEKEPTFWVEVFNPAEQWLTKEELAKFNATLKPAKKRGRPVGSKNKKLKGTNVKWNKTRGWWEKV